LEPFAPTGILFIVGIGTLLFMALKGSLAYPLAHNEGAFVLIGREMGHGARLYADLWDHKPPFYFAQSWLLQWFFPLTEINLHLYALFTHGLTAFFLFLLARRLGFSFSGAWIAAASYAALLFPPLFQPWAVESDLLIQPFLIFSFWAALSPSLGTVFLSGLLFGAAFLTKQSVLFLVPAYAVLLGVRNWGRWLRWAIGVGFVVAGVLLYFELTGRAMDFEEALWSFNAHYVQVGWQFFWQNGAFRDFLAKWTRVALLTYGLPLIVSALAWLVIPLGQGWGRILCFIALWFGTLLGSAAASGYFFSYYFVALLPPLALALGAAWERFELAGRKELMLGFVLIGGGVFALALPGSSLYAKVFRYAEYPTDRYWQDKAAGVLLALQARPGDQLLSWSDDPQVYVYSGLTPFIKTPFINHLSYMPYQAAKTYEDFQKKPPRFVAMSRLDQVLPSPEWLKDALKINYSPVKSSPLWDLYVLQPTPGLK